MTGFCLEHDRAYRRWLLEVRRLEVLVIVTAPSAEEADGTLDLIGQLAAESLYR